MDLRDPVIQTDQILQIRYGDLHTWHKIMLLCHFCQTFYPLVFCSFKKEQKIKMKVICVTTKLVNSQEFISSKQTAFLPISTP